MAPLGPVASKQWRRRGIPPPVTYRHTPGSRCRATFLESHALCWLTALIGRGWFVWLCVEVAIRVDENLTLANFLIKHAKDALKFSRECHCYVPNQLWLGDFFSFRSTHMSLLYNIVTCAFQHSPPTTGVTMHNRSMLPWVGFYYPLCFRTTPFYSFPIWVHKVCIAVCLWDVM